MDEIIDKLVFIGIVLFVLSLVTEKITFLIRKYLPHRIIIFNWIANLFRNKKKPPPDRTEAVHKEKQPREVSLLSTAVGILVAVLFEKNLILLIKQTAIPTLTLDSLEWIESILGYFFTGVFLSFGSKFFHDLLDTLLQIKNLKRKLNDEKTYRIKSIEQLEKHLKLTEEDLVSKAIADYKGLLMGIPNVSGMGMGYCDVDGKQTMCVSVHVRDGDIDRIPSQLHLNLPAGVVNAVPVHVVPDVGQIKLHNAISPGAGIGNKANNETGTLGGLLRNETNGKEYFLTCYHVLNAGHDWPIFEPKRNKQVVVEREGEEKRIGKLVYGRRDEFLDIALVEKDDNIEYLKDTHSAGKIKDFREVKRNDARFKTEVFFCGSSSGHDIEGNIVNFNYKAEKFPYPDGDFDLEGLIVLSKVDGNKRSKITKPGDSGAIVFDKEFKALGLIVGGDDKYSYAIPINRIVKHLKKLKFA